MEKSADTESSDCFDTRKIVQSESNGDNIELEVFIAGESNKNGLTFLFLHGLGMSAHSFSLVTRMLKSRYCIVAPNLRNHGKSFNNADMSLDALVSDATTVLRCINDTSLFCCSCETSASPIVPVVIGHSASGSVAAKLATNCSHLVAGVVTIDTTEETALLSLSYLAELFENGQIPSSFESLEGAIQWHINTRRPSNHASACLSVPQLISGDLTWRTDLMQFRQFWQGWFEGFVLRMENLTVPSLIIVGSVDRLGSDLSIARAKGSLNIRIVSSPGHCIQEDCPLEVIREVLHFSNRWKFIK